MYQLGAPGCLADPEAVLEATVTIARQLAARGLVHCDLNEFNLIVEQNTSAVTLIDFPQMISTKHPNAAMYFERDVRGLVKFFTMKLKFDVDEEGLFDFDGACASEAVTRLDTACRASGFDGCAPDKREGRSRVVKAVTEEEEDDNESDDDGVEALRAEFLARARVDAPAADAPPPPPDTARRGLMSTSGDASRPPPPTAIVCEPCAAFDEDEAAPVVAPPPEVCAQKLRRERDKQLTRRARHNGSRNFAKTRSSHGKIKHKEKLDQEY